MPSSGWVIWAQHRGTTKIAEWTCLPFHGILGPVGPLPIGMYSNYFLKSYFKNMIFLFIEIRNP